MNRCGFWSQSVAQRAARPDAVLTCGVPGQVRPRTSEKKRKEKEPHRIEKKKDEKRDRPELESSGVDPWGETVRR